MLWVDQTLNEGLGIGINKGNIEKVIALLQELQVTTMDCRVAEWQKYDLAVDSISSHIEMRGAIHATVEEVELAYQLGFKSIMFTCKMVPGENVLNLVSDALLRARRLNMKVAVGIENASRFSVEEMRILGREFLSNQVRTFVYIDGESLLTPLSTFTVLRELIESMPLPVEFHGHNACGLATANALEAIRAGVKRIGGAVAGVGQYGNAAFEEVTMAQRFLLGQGNDDTRKLAFICSQVLAEIGVVLPGTKAIIGADIFAHESGIHVDGVIKNPQLYEAFLPEDVGLVRKIIIGKHSGTASLVAKFKQWNVLLTAIEAQALLKEVRKKAVVYKKPVDDDMLWELYQSRAV